MEKSIRRAITMGNFDGCHLGHQALFRSLKAVAEVNGLVPTVISFEPHSNYVLRTPGDPLLLTTTEEKREFVESLGLEFMVMPFTPEMAKLPFDEFVRNEAALVSGAKRSRRSKFDPVLEGHAPDGDGGEHVGIFC